MIIRGNDNWVNRAKIILVIFIFGFIACPLWDSLIEQDIYQESLTFTTGNSEKKEIAPDTFIVKNKIIDSLLYKPKDSILEKNNLKTDSAFVLLKSDKKVDSIKTDLVIQKEKSKEAYVWTIKNIY